MRILLLGLGLALAASLTGSSLCTASNGCEGVYGCSIYTNNCARPCTCVAPRGQTPRCVDVGLR